MYSGKKCGTLVLLLLYWMCAEGVCSYVCACECVSVCCLQVSLHTFMCPVSKTVCEYFLVAMAAQPAMAASCVGLTHNKRVGGEREREGTRNGERERESVGL